MQITFKSRHSGKKDFTLEQIAMLHDFTTWVLAKFINKRLSNKLHVTIILDKKLYAKTSVFGFMEWTDKPKKGNTFILEIDTSQSFIDILATLAHELVHVKQSKLAECYDTDKNTVVFAEKKYDSSSVNYWETPWEIEAYGRSIGLVKLWISDRKFSKEKWAKESIKF